MSAAVLVIFLIVFPATNCVYGQQTIEQCYQSNSLNYCFRTTFTDNTADSLSWDDAKTRCLQLNSTLLSIRDDHIQRLSVQFLLEHEVAPYEVWTSAVRRPQSTWTWTNGTTTTSAILNSDVESNDAGAVYFNDSMSPTLTAYDGRLSNQFICQFKGMEKCLPYRNKTGYLTRNNDDECYVIFPRLNQHASLSWYNALSACLRFEGNLADSSVLDVARSSSSWLSQERAYWVGLVKDPFVWSAATNGEDTVMKYNNFDSGSSEWNVNRSCVSLSYGRHSYWVSRRCSASDANYFLCLSVSDVELESTNGTILSTTTINHLEKQLQPLTVGQVIGIGVGSGLFLILCIIITAVVACKCAHRCGSSCRSSSERAKPNDYANRRTETSNNSASSDQPNKKQKQKIKTKYRSKSKNSRKQSDHSIETTVDDDGDYIVDIFLKK